MNISDFDGTFKSFADIEDMVQAFEAARLSAARWTHHAHLIVGTWYMSRFEFRDAIDRIRRGIKRHNASVGTLNTPTSGYHETITLAWAKLIRGHFLATGPIDGNSIELYRSIVDKFNDPRHLLRFYEKDTLMSTIARANWVEPDKAPLR